MKIKTTPILSLLFLCFFTSAYIAQSPSELHTEYQLIINSDPQKAMELAEQEIEISKLHSKDWLNGMVDLGNAYYYFDEYDQGLKILFEAIEVAEKQGFKGEKANAHVICGNIYLLTGELSNALNHFTDGLTIFEKLNNNTGMALCNNGLGSINKQQENYEKALDYFSKALNTGDATTKGDTYISMSQIFLKLEAYGDAKSNAELALEIGFKTEDAYIQAYAYDVIGKVLFFNGELDKSNNMFYESLELKESLEDNQGTSATLILIGQNLKKLGYNDSAMTYILNAKELAEEIGANTELRESLGELAKLYAIKGDFENAFVYQTKFIEINEAISNDQASKKMAEMEAEMEAKLKEDQIALLEKDKEHEAETFKIYVGIAIFVLFVILMAAIAAYKRFQAKKKAHADLEQKNAIIEEQKDFLEEQKHVLEEKNTEIMDSITYAKRIQSAILPSNTYFADTLPSGFVLYKPKDIIAGDFYWVEETDNDLILFAAADCTGHGVPGAMVSVVCNNALNRSVREFELSQPSLILDKTRELVIEQFEKSESEVKDGMDISLCCIDTKSSKLYWSGANNPIWVLRKVGGNKLIANITNEGDVQEFEPNQIGDNYVLFEIKPDKQPIGKYSDPKPFRNWEITVEKDDRIYVFTDGYADQFGGAKGKKFMSANMKKLLISMQEQPIHEHKLVLDQNFETYRSEHEQIDDVCIIGYKVV
jgi:serine phosphatase RsbU (regulator of sigma subunit)/Tfp pilus assembly protein PilF